MLHLGLDARARWTPRQDLTRVRLTGAHIARLGDGRPHERARRHHRFLAGRPAAVGALEDLDEVDRLGAVAKRVSVVPSHLEEAENERRLVLEGHRLELAARRRRALRVRRAVAREAVDMLLD